MDILAILPESIGGRLTTQSIIDGLIANQCFVVVYDELFDTKETLLNHLKNHKFDYILGYDYSAIANKIENNLEIKTINYFSDFIEGKGSGEHHHKYLQALKQEGNYNFYWDKEDTKRLEGKFWHLKHLPHFVNTNVYYDRNKERTVDIMFAGRLDTYFRLHNMLKICDTFKDFSISWYAIKKHYEDALSRCERKEQAMLEKIYRGFIGSEEDMARELNKAKIVINFHSQGKSAVNYRTFQAMASGCVVLSDYQQEMSDLFQVDKELLCFNSFKDFISKVYVVTKDEEFFKKISTAAQKRIQNDFNAKKGAAEILNCLK